MFLQKNKITGIKKLEPTGGIVSRKHHLTSLNVEKFKGVLSYFSYLHTNGEISDKAFETLVSYACSIFIENEVEIVVQDTLERKFIHFLSSKFSTSVDEIEDLEASIYML